MRRVELELVTVRDLRRGERTFLGGRHCTILDIPRNGYIKEGRGRRADSEGIKDAIFVGNYREIAKEPQLFRTSSEKINISAEVLPNGILEPFVKVGTTASKGLIHEISR